MRSPAMVVALALTFLMCAGSTVSRAQISTATLTQANSDLQAGEVDKAIALLATLPSTGAGAAEAQNLLCRVRITLEQWSQAAAECQQAVNLDEQNSNYHMWLGRVLGQEASHASFITRSSSFMPSVGLIISENCPKRNWRNERRWMSALGHKRTLFAVSAMSALPPKPPSADALGVHALASCRQARAGTASKRSSASRIRRALRQRM